MFRRVFLLPLLAALFGAPLARAQSSRRSFAVPAAAIAQTSPPAPAASPAAPQQAAKAAQPAAEAQQPISAQMAAAESAIAASDWKSAETKLNDWLASHPADPRALFDAGYVADAQNHLDDAAGFYRRAIAADPNSFLAHISLGLLLAREGKFKEARPILAAATKLNPGDAGPALMARAWSALARIDSTSDPTLASSELLKALQFAPTTVDDTLLAASLAERTGQIDGAATAYRSVLAQDPNSKRAIIGLAHILIQKKQYSQAEALLRPALQKNPGDPTLTAQLATALAAENKPEAVPLLQQLHAAHPTDIVITRMLADVMADAGEYAASDQLYVQLLAAAPDDPDLLIAHGQNLVQELKFGQAYAVFNQVTQIDPTNGDGWSGLAFTASKTGRPAVTIHALTMRSQYLPENASTYFLWATAYDTLRMNAQAIVYYRHFLAAAGGHFPDQEWQARQRLQLLEK